MNHLINKLDRSSRILILIAILGIISSAYSIYYLSRGSSEVTGKDKLASITVFSNDTRLKRSGNINWYNVSQNVDCYEDDRIFTGKDSYATIVFEGGGEVVVLPNSLVSLSKGFIKLNSGTIEVDLKKGSLGVDSFGEKFIADENSKFRLEDRDKVKRIVSLDNKEISIKNDALKELMKPEKITILRPGTGERIPKFPNSSVRLSWKTPSELADANFRLDFSNSEDFSTQTFTANTKKTSFTVPVNALPNGKVYWRVTETNRKSISSSVFNLETDINIKLLNPASGASYPVAKVATAGITLEWGNPLSYAQKLQLSQTQNFAKILKEFDVSETQKTILLNTEGNFFWRVGYPYGSNQYHWSEVSSFKLKPDIAIAPLELLGMVKLMDFSTTPEYIVEVKDLNQCDEFDFVIYKDNKIDSTATTDQPGLRITKMEDGEYSLKVVGKKKKEVIVESITAKFTVKNSPPLKAPKIKNKKNVKLYVQVLRSVVDFIIPSATAAPSAFYRLEWEEEKGATYEVEISKADKSIVETRKTKEPFYKFVIPGPERYFWRVRSFRKNQKSPFSDYAEIEARDRVYGVTAPLMEAPANGAVIVGTDENEKVKFKWKEPSKNFKYFLEIYNPSSPTPVKTFDVSRGSHFLLQKDLPAKFEWRVVGKSSFDNLTQNTDKFSAEVRKYVKPVSTSSLILKPFVGFLSTTFEQDFKDDQIPDLASSADFSGPAMGLEAEYLMGSYNNRKSLSLHYRKMSFTEGENKFDESRMGAEFGWLGDWKAPTSHNYYLGYALNTGTYALGTELDLENEINYLRTRYVYRKTISEKFLLLLDGSLFFQMDNFGVPSVLAKPTLSYKLGRSWSLDSSLLFERFSGKFKSTGEAKGDITTQSQSMGILMGLSWQSGK